MLQDLYRAMLYRHKCGFMVTQYNRSTSPSEPFLASNQALQPTPLLPRQPRNQAGSPFEVSWSVGDPLLAASQSVVSLFNRPATCACEPVDRLTVDALPVA